MHDELAARGGSGRATDGARDVAYLCLLDALACAFQALQDPACTRLLGPVVPGATMTFGARVPGTSFQLDPVQAAFNLGTMIGWLDQQDAALATCGAHLADTLGALLSVADYQARKALAEGRPPATVRDVLDALLDAAVQRPAERAASHRAATMTIDRCDAARIACATSITSLLGATAMQRARAHHLAAREALVNDAVVQRPSSWLGDANARGVRIALLAMAEVPDRAWAWADRVGSQPASSLQPQATALSLLQTPDLPACDTSSAQRIRERFLANATAHFPPVQAGKLKAALADRSRLEGMPVNELVSMTVRN